MAVDPKPTPFDWLVLLFCVAVIACLAICGRARGATAPREWNCQEALHTLHAKREAHGDRLLGITQMRNGGADINYMNDRSGKHYEYVLLAAFRHLSSPQQPMRVWTRCLIYQPGKQAIEASIYESVWVSL